MKKFFVVLLAVLAILSIAPSAQAQISGSVNFTTTKQQIDGFGVAATFGRPWMIQSATGTVPNKVLDQLFNPVTGAGISMLRLGIDDVLGSGATDTGSAPNSGIQLVPTRPANCATPPTYPTVPVGSSGGWDGSAGGEVWIGQQALKYGIKRFYANSWGAPAYMKSNNNLISGGVVCGGPGVTGSNCTTMGDCRAAYANYMVQFIRDFQLAGVPISDFDWENEPTTNNNSYATMTPTAAQASDFQKVLGPIVQTAISSGKINSVNMECCDSVGWTNNGAPFTTQFVTTDPAAGAYIYAYTSHEYGNLPTTPLPTGGKKSWMTEWGPSSPSAWNPYWDAAFSGTSSNYNDGMYVANDISGAVASGGVSAYIWWYSDSTSTTGAMIEMGGPWVNGQTYESYPYYTYTVPARLYSLAHFARYVRPGAYYVPVTMTNNPACTSIAQGKGACLVPTGFVNTDGSKVINVVNNIVSGNEVLTLTLDAGTANWVPTAYVTDVATIPNANANSSTPEPTNTAIALTPGMATVNGTTLTATLPARSFTTIVLTPPVVSGTVNLVLTPVLTAQGDGAVLGTVTVSNTGTGTAQNVQLTSASLGTSAGTTQPTGALPFTIGNIAPGSSEVVYVNFAAGQTPGSMVVEKFAGTYSGGSFGGSVRALVPSLLQ